MSRCKAEDCELPVRLSKTGRETLYCSVACSNRTRNRNHDRRERYASYGAELADYDRLFMEQGGRCAICGTDKPGSRKQAVRFAFDHDHKTGQPRSLLCYLCNVGLGSFQDNRELLIRAASYLERHSPTTAAINPGCASTGGAINPPTLS